MNRNVLIVMAGGVLVAVLVAMIVSATLGGGNGDKAKTEDQVMIAVASKAIKSGEAVNETNVKWQSWPKSGVFDGAIVKGEKKLTEAVKGRVRRDIAMGEPITKASLVAEKANFLAATLAPGMRAVSIKVKAESSVSGFVAPGDRVDVLLSYKVKITVPGGSNSVAQDVIERNIDKYATETILENVKVLAVDQSAKRDEEKVKVGKTVTLEVDQKGAEILALGEAVGTLSLALRSLGDDIVRTRPTAVTTDERITNIYDEILAEISRKLGTGQSGNIVRIYSGDSVGEIKVVP